MECAFARPWNMLVKFPEQVICPATSTREILSARSARSPSADQGAAVPISAPKARMTPDVPASGDMRRSTSAASSRFWRTSHLTEVPSQMAPA